MAGYWPQSRSQIHDLNGNPLVSARAYFYEGGTTTPIVVYRDSGLGSAHPNPLVSDGYGFFPSVFLDEADEFYRVRVTTSSGVLLYDDDGIPIIGPTGGGGGSETPVDPDSLMKTGDMMVRYGSEVRPGFVRLNGRSIGSATSGASERANSDTQALFEYLWNTDSAIVVTGGRGASAAADFGANKPLILPDYRGRALVGLDTMGNTAANVLPDADDLGWVGGDRTHTLTTAQIPAHTHGVTDPGHSHVNPYKQPIYQADTDRGSSSSLFSIDQFTENQATSSATTGITINSAGGGEAHNNVQPSKACSVYMRL